MKRLPRVFRYNSVELEDPGPEHDPVDVRNLYANTYPEILNAAIEGPEEKDGKHVYTFRKAVGTKGSTPSESRNEPLLPKGQAEVSLSASTGHASVSIGKFVVADINPGLASIGFDTLAVADAIAKAWNSALSEKKDTPDPITGGTVEQDAERFRYLFVNVHGEIRHIGYASRRWVWDAPLGSRNAGFAEAIDYASNTHRQKTHAAG